MINMTLCPYCGIGEIGTADSGFSLYCKNCEAIWECVDEGDFVEQVKSLVKENKSLEIALSRL